MHVCSSCNTIDGLVHELLERHHVAFELGEDINSPHGASAVDTRVQICHQSDSRITYFELTGQDRLRVSGHVDQTEPLVGEPSAFGPSRESWPLNHHHRPAVHHAGQVGRGGAHRRAVRIGEPDVDAAGIEIRVVTTAGAVDQLVGHHDCTGTQVRCQTADRARSEDTSDTERAQRPHVGAVRHGVRGEFVPGAMPWQECDLVVADGADGDRGTRLAVGSVQVDAAGVGPEEGIEPAAADDSEQGPLLARGFVLDRPRRTPSPIADFEYVGRETADGVCDVLDCGGDDRSHIADGRRARPDDLLHCVLADLRLTESLLHVISLPRVPVPDSRTKATTVQDLPLVASFAQWVEGARPRTLPNAIAPVIAGSGAAAWLHGLCWWKALLAMVVAVAMIIGVNYANDYSDGIRGTDDVRAGPLRLVGSKVATPRSVLTAAVISLAIAAAAGLALAWFSAPWLILVGGLCIAGAWLYTGGSKPYGYLGLGEVAVFVFFGLVAVLGTQYTQALRIDWVGGAMAVAMGAMSSAVLVANNLRDIPTDKESGKITLAVRLGDPRTRLLYQGLMAVAFVLTLVLMLATPWAAVGLVALPLAVRAAGPVRKGLGGKELIPVLRDTGLTMLVWSVAVAAALFFG